jgi:hypothetical protein
MRRALFGLVGLVAAAVAVTPRDAQACGGCFHPPSQSGDVITDERMGFVVTPQQTTLYDEINYQGNPASFAWVLPIHGQVTVGLSADIAFEALDAATQTTIVAPNLPPCASCQCGEYGGANAAAPTGSGSGSSSGGGGVTVISQQTVGPYDTVQLSSTNPNALNAWLTANGYVIPADIQPILTAYVTEGFNFLALRLAPGQGVNAMRPVRVTSTGAGLSLPLRMVAAGTGASVGITIWVLADGRYEPQNAKTFTVNPSTLVWDWSVGSSNYTTVVAQQEALYNNAAWQIESSLDVLPTQVEGTILADDPTQDYLPTGGDGDAGDGGPGESAEQVRQDDLAALFPGGDNTSVRITRFRGDIARAALSSDLVLQASADQSPMSNIYQVTQSVNAPTCPAVPNPCPCGAGSSGGFGGGIFGESSSTGTSGGGNSSGCTTAPASGQEGDSGIPIVLAGIVGAAMFLNRRGKRR